MASVPHIETRGPEARQEEDCSDGGAIREPSLEFADSPFTEDPEAGLFVLPGGFVSDDGAAHRQAVMRPVTGFDEEWLMELPGGAFAACVVTGLLTRCLVRLGTICPVPDSVVRGLLVSDREYLIMKLRETTFGTRVDSVIRCANGSCGKPMHVNFNLSDYAICLLY